MRCSAYARCGASPLGQIVVANAESVLVCEADTGATAPHDWQRFALRAVPKLIETLALEGVVFAFDAMNTQKNFSHHYED